MVTFYSFCWSVIISSIFVLTLYFLRKKMFFILNFGVPILLLLFTFSLVRILIPFEFSWQKIISDRYIYAILMYPYIWAGKYHNFLFSIIMGIWIIGICFFSYRFFKKTFSSYAYLREIDKCISNDITNIFSRIHTGKKIPIFKSSAIETPFLVGLFHPEIYIPTYEYTEEQLYYILLHEYTHYKNKDLWVKLLCNLFCIVFWWNPIIYLLPKDLNAILELKCDATLAKELTEEEQISYLDTILFTLHCMNSNNKAHTDKLSFTTAFVRPIANLNKQRFQALTKSIQKNNGISSFSKFTIICLLCLSFLSSYYFILQPSYETPDNELWEEGVDAVFDSSNSYLVPNEAGDYNLYYNNEFVGVISIQDIQSGFCDIPIKKEKK